MQNAGGNRVQAYVWSSEEVFQIKEFITKNKTLFMRITAILAYTVFYMTGFSWLEKRHVTGVHIMTLSIDYKIPFLEIFIIPYVLWFVYIAVTVVYFLIHEEEDFDALAQFLVFGMTVFLLISAVYPNGLNLRPVTFERDNIFTDIVKFIYASDTPTNVLPSIHVYNSMAAFLAIKRSRLAKNNSKWAWASGILTLLIILSTMFVKQHSVFDVFCAMVLTVFANHLYYGVRIPESKRKLHKQWI